MIMCNKCNQMVPAHHTYTLIMVFSSCPDATLCLNCWECLENNIRLSREATINAFLERKIA